MALESGTHALGGMHFRAPLSPAHASRPGLRGAAIAPHLVIIRVTVTMADVTVGIGTGRYFGGPLTGGGFAKRSSPFG